jgi:flagellar protein FlaJ
LKIYPSAYFAMIGFIFLVSLIVMVPIIVLTGLLYLIPLPFVVLLLGYAIPKIMARDRSSKLDAEVPFAGAYISVMATGGLSPYASLRRLKDCPLLPQIAKNVKDIEVDVQMKGIDPVTAMEKSAQHLPSRDYRDLFLGYASTLKTGGDVVHYLLVRTETMFRDLAVKVKAFADRAAVLMEAYVSISILVTLSLAIIFMTSTAFASYWHGGFTTENYLLYAYILVPLLSMAFIYLADAQQVHEPVSEWGPYKVFLATLPIMIFMLITMFFPFLSPDLSPPFAKPFMDFIVFLRQTLGLQQGFEASLGLALALIVGHAPAAYAHSYYARRGRGLESEITNFLRDFTETRKTGASPESCMENLAGRNYGRFTKHLSTASRQIRWGLPFKTIYETLRTKIRSWLALINLYLMVDAIEVGGGTPETMETLTRFSELLSSQEKEKKEMLKPLLIMPYIGAAILLFSTIVFLSFTQTVLYSYAHQAIPFSQFATIIVPPLILQAYLTGIVTGKISSTTVSAGFKHALILVVLAVVLICLGRYLTIPFQGFG